MRTFFCLTICWYIVYFFIFSSGFLRKWKKWKMFFSHIPGSLDTIVLGVRSHSLLLFASFLVAVYHCLNSHPHPRILAWQFFIAQDHLFTLFVLVKPLLGHEFSFSLVISTLQNVNYLSNMFSCWSLSYTIFYHFVIMVRLRGLAWRGFQLCVRLEVNILVCQMLVWGWFSHWFDVLLLSIADLSENI